MLLRMENSPGRAFQSVARLDTKAVATIIIVTTRRRRRQDRIDGNAFASEQQEEGQASEQVHGLPGGHTRSHAHPCLALAPNRAAEISTSIALVLPD